MVSLNQNARLISLDLGIKNEQTDDCESCEQANLRDREGREEPFDFWAQLLFSPDL